MMDFEADDIFRDDEDDLDTQLSLVCYLISFASLSTFSLTLFFFLKFSLSGKRVEQRICGLPGGCFT